MSLTVAGRGNNLGSLTLAKGILSGAVLDTLSVPAVAAYGTQKLTGKYNGPALRVRRSSDNAEVDIGFTSVGDLNTFTLMQHVTAENGFKWSGDFTNAVWLKGMGGGNTVVTPNQVTSPDGTLSGALVYSSAGVSHVGQTFPVVLGNTYTVTAICSARPGSLDTTTAIRIEGTGFNNSGANFPLTVGSITLVTRTFVANATETITAGPRVSNGANASNGIYLFGAQINAGAVASDYTQTTAAATTATSGFITTWYDQSGNGRDLAQATAANQPRIVNVGVIDRINTRAAVRTDGVSQTMATAAFAIAQPYTHSSVLQYLSVPSGSNRVYIGSTAAPDTGEGVNGATGIPYMFGGTSLNIKGVTIAANDRASVVAAYNGANSIGSYNGVPVVGDAGATGANGVRIGAAVGPAVFGDALLGNVLLFPAALSTGDRLALESYQKVYFGL